MAFLPGRFVDFLLHRDAFDHVVEFNLAGLLGENRHVVRIPLHEGLALLDLAAVGTEMTEPMTMLCVSSSRPSSSMDADRSRSCSGRC